MTREAGWGAVKAVPSRRRSATVARLLEKELARHTKGLEQACLAANADQALNAEIQEWQAFDHTPRARRCEP